MRKWDKARHKGTVRHSAADITDSRALRMFVAIAMVLLLFPPTAIAVNETGGSSSGANSNGMQTFAQDAQPVIELTAYVDGNPLIAGADGKVITSGLDVEVRASVSDMDGYAVDNSGNAVVWTDEDGYWSASFSGEADKCIERNVTFSLRAEDDSADVVSESLTLVMDNEGPSVTNVAISNVEPSVEEGVAYLNVNGYGESSEASANSVAVSASIDGASVSKTSYLEIKWSDASADGLDTSVKQDADGKFYIPASSFIAADGTVRSAEICIVAQDDLGNTTKEQVSCAVSGSSYAIFACENALLSDKLLDGAATLSASEETLKAESGELYSGPVNLSIKLSDSINLEQTKVIQSVAGSSATSAWSDWGEVVDGDSINRTAQIGEAAGMWKVSVVAATEHGATRAYEVSSFEVTDKTPVFSQGAFGVPAAATSVTSKAYDLYAASSQVLVAKMNNADLVSSMKVATNTGEAEVSVDKATGNVIVSGDSSAFKSDEEYTSVTLKVTDVFGRTSEQAFTASTPFSVDKTDPEITISLGGANTSALDGFAGQLIKPLLNALGYATVTVSDKNLDVSSLTATVAQAKVPSAAWVVSKDGTQAYATVFGKAQQEGDLELGQGTDLTATAGGADYVGNSAEAIYASDKGTTRVDGLTDDQIANLEKTFAVDYDPVVVESLVIDETAGVGTAADDGDLFKVGEVRATITLRDQNLDTTNTSVYLVKDDVETKLPLGEWTATGDRDAVGALSQSASFTMSGEGLGYSLKIVAYDLANNSETIYWYGDEGLTEVGGVVTNSKTFAFDTTCPNVAVDLKSAPITSEGQDGNDYFDGTVVAEVTVSDENISTSSKVEVDGVELSGDKWTINPDAAGTLSMEIELGPSSLGEDGRLTPHVIEVAAVDATGVNATSYSYGENSEASGNGGQKHTTALGSALAGATGIVVDVDNPDVTVTMTPSPTVLAGAEGGNDYYAASVTALVTVSDASIDPAKALVSVDGGAFETLDWQLVTPEAGTGASVAVCGEVTFAENDELNEDGSVKAHTLEVRVADKAQRLNEYAYGDVCESSQGVGAKRTVGADGADLRTAPADTAAFGIVVDETAPDVKVTLDQPLRQNWNGSDYFSTVGSSGFLTATVEVTDINFDAQNAVVTALVDGKAATGASQEWTQDGSTWRTQVTYAENMGTLSGLTVSAPDILNRGFGDVSDGSHMNSYAYGQQVVGSNGGSKETYAQSAIASDEAVAVRGSSFVVDLTAPQVASSDIQKIYDGVYGLASNADYNEGASIFYGSDQEVSIEVTDANKVQSASVSDPFALSIAEGDLSNLAAAEAKLSVSLIEGVDSSERNELDGSIKLTLSDYAYNTRVWNISPNGKVTEVSKNPADAIDSPNTPIFIGETFFHPTRVVLDKTAPQLTWTGTTAVEGEFTNQTRQVRLNVEELNFDYLQQFDGDQALLTVNRKAGDSSYAQSSWSVTAAEFGGLGSAFSTVQSFAEDGHYSLVAQVIDPALNRSEISFAEFTIDKTAPVLSVAYDNNDARNETYYKDYRTATVTVVEHNFDPALINVSAPGASIGGWSTNGDTHTLIVSFAADGDYTFDISGQDKAGNALQSYSTAFTIDTTPPTIQIGLIGEGELNGSAHNGDIQPTITFSDEANYDSNGISYTLSGSKNGAVDYAIQSRSATDTGEIVTYANFADDIAVDDIYTITATMTDLAGNESEQAVSTFSVNRYGSNFRVVDADAYQGSYLNEARDVLIEEINVSGVSAGNHDITVQRGTESVRKLVADEGYTVASEVSSETSSNGWALYTYTVGSDNFDTDGSYVVTVTSTDNATNVNNSESFNSHDEGAAPEEKANAQVEFVLDKTAPLVKNFNVASGQRINSDNYTVTFDVVESIGLDSVEATLDGQSVAVKSEGYNSYSLQIPAKSFSTRTLTVVATDKAQNTSEGAAGNEGLVSGFKVSTNPLDLYWEIIAGVAVVVVAAAIALFVALKRRKGESEGAQAAESPSAGE